ncbi:MAG: hypothetical protein IJ593_04775 [Lachnospiraceae bacterium]|nr:hypothetical protein [Lachnospiraceae bacterium]
MSCIKRLCTALLAILIMCSVATPALAAEEVQVNENVVTQSKDYLNSQLDELYHMVGKELHINYMYVKLLHMIAGGKAVYADSKPNIFVDTTVDSLAGAFDIDGVNQEYKLTAPFVDCPDSDVERPSKYYLPDAAYNVTASIVTLMNTRYRYDRGTMQGYFDSREKAMKTTICFCEAVLLYTGSDIETVNNFYRIYERMLYEKENNEYVIEMNEYGNYSFKEKFLQILKSNGIEDAREIEILNIILRFDSKLAASCYSDLADLDSNEPYVLNYPSRENLMTAAMSLVGKVKYVWGGGHLSTGNVEGINPIWINFYNAYGDKYDEHIEILELTDDEYLEYLEYVEMTDHILKYDFNDYYIVNRNAKQSYTDEETGKKVINISKNRIPLVKSVVELIDNETELDDVEDTENNDSIGSKKKYEVTLYVENEHYYKCIRPNGPWCPIHGMVELENACLFSSNTVYSLDEYLDIYYDIYDISAIDNSKTKEMLKAVDFEGGITPHRLDGLDCSGYMTWVFNQITDKYSYDSGALGFIGQYGMQKIDDENLLPGDVFSWGDHIVMIVGYVDDYNTYVIIESGPNTIKFGVGYFNNATVESIAKAHDIAKEANTLIGNIGEKETIREFNMSELAFEGTDENTIKSLGYHGFGRYRDWFIDEDSIVSGYNKKLKEMSAVEVIQHTIDSLGYDYITGIDTYSESNEFFNIDNIEIPKVDETVIDTDIDNAEIDVILIDSNSTILVDELQDDNN